MTINKILSLKVFIGLLIAIFFVAGCKKDDDILDGPNRLFRPTVKGNIESEGNWISTNWEKVKGASGYTLQISRDTFKTIDVTLNVDTNYAYVQHLAWNQLYQLRVKALASDTVMNSRWADVGAKKTPKFPTIMAAPGASDLQDNSIRVKWTNSGSTVTSIKVHLLSDSSLVKEVALSGIDVNAQEKIVSGLSGSTTYIVYLYSGTSLRGWDNFTTKASLTGSVVDLRDFSNPQVLFDTLSKVDAGSTILLARGKTYTIPSSFIFTKSVKIMTGAGFDGGRAVLSLSANFDANGTIDYLRFEDLIISQGASTQYFMNVGYVAKITEVTFENCKTEGVFDNSFIRLKTSGDEIGTLTFNNCVIGNFGILNKYSMIFANANSNAKINNIAITNSTFYKLYQFIRQDGVTTNSAVISDCTFNEVVNNGGYFINYTTFPPTLTISNSIIGKTLDPTNSKFINKTGNPVFTNTYYTTDAVHSGNKISDLTTKPIAYSKASIDLFKDVNTFDFTLNDASFEGKSSAGDPRWRP